MGNELAFDILADDRASANISKVGRSMKSMSADVELANVRMEKATKAADAAVEKYGKDSLQAREALAKLAKAEDAAETAAKRLGAAERRAAGEIEAAGEAAEAAGEATEEAAGKFDGLKAGAGAAGAGAGALLTKGFIDNLSIEAGTAKLTAQLGLTSEESGQAGRLAGEVYRDNFGDSMESVNEALRVVWSSMRAIGQDSPGEIESATKAAMLLSDTFDVDVSESVRAATRLIQTGLVKDSTEAFDLVAKGFQTGSGQADDMLETLTEYSSQWQKLGLSGQDAMGLLSQGLKAGARDTDYIADAVKEFALISVSGSKDARAGFEALGMDAASTSAVIARGGDGARTAFGQVLDGLRGIEDPLKRNDIGLKLFGSKWEDLGPQVVAALSLADGAIGGTTGTIDRMMKTMGETGAARLESWKRGLEGMLQSAAGAPGVLGATAAGLATIGPSALSSAGDMGMMVMGLQALNLHGDRAKGVLKGVGIAAAALAAAQVSGAIFGGDSGVKGIETTTKALREMAAGSDDTTGALKHLDEDLANVGTTGRSFGGFLESMTGGFAGLAGDGSVAAVDARIASLDATLAKLVSSGSAGEATALFGTITEKAKAQGTSVEALAKAFPQYQNAIDAASNSQRTSAGASASTALALDQEATSMKQATAAAVEHSNALLGLRGGEVGYWGAVDATTAALATNGATLDVHTEKGRANRTALDGQARAARDYLQGLIDSDLPAAQFNARLSESRARLEAAGVRFGMTRAAARQYAADVLGIPRVATTRANFDDSGARAKLASFRRALSAIQNPSVNPGPWAGGYSFGRSGGGLIPGQPSARDNRLMPVATGEYVVNARATASNLPMLEAINAGRVRGYAAGGYVGMKAPAGYQSATGVTLNIYAPVGSQQELQEWLVAATRKLQRIGRL